MNHIPLSISFTLVLVATAVLTCMPAVGHAAEGTSKGALAVASTMNSADSAFVSNSLLDGMLMVQSATLALKRGLTGEERQFATKLSEDHTALNEELSTLAKSKSVWIPTNLDTKRQAKFDALGRKTDQEFAAAYLSDQIDAHKDAISAFKEASEDAKDVDVKVLALKNLAGLTTHLEQVRILAKKH